MPWILLSAAILLEVAGITSMKLSRGFAEPLPSIRRADLLCAVGGGGDPGAEAA
jgi:multidrug transporter EmrE-like cation transporter